MLMELPRTSENQLPAVFDPRKSADTLAKTEAVIEYARKVLDWPLLEKAIDVKIEEQQEFVEWWKATVTPNKGGDRKSDQKRRSAFLVADAEQLTSCNGSIS